MDRNPPLVFTLNLYSIYGQDLRKDGTRLYNLRSLQTLIFYIFILSLNILEVILNYRSEKLLNYLETISNHFWFVTEMIMFQLNLHKFKILIKTDDFWPIDFINDELAKKQKKYYKLLYTLFKISYMSCIVVVSLTFFRMYFAKTYIPYELYHIVDFKKSPYMQIFHLLFIVYQFKIICFVFALDGLFYCSVCFLFCQIKMLKHALRNLDMEYVDKEGEERCFQELTFYNKHFNKILDYYSKVDDCYSYFILIKFISTVMNFAAPLYLIDVNARIELSILAESFMLLIDALLVIFMQCTSASLVSDEMDYNPVMKYGLFVMKCVGQNLENPKLFDDVIWLLFFVVVVFCYVLSLLEPIYNFENVEKLPEYLDVICNYHIFVSILFLYRLKRCRIGVLIKPEGFWKINSINEQTTVKQMKCYRFLRICYNLTFTVGLFLVAATYLKPFIQKERKLPLAFYNIIDFTKTPYYEIFYIIFVIHSTYIYFIVIGLDGIFYSALCFIYCQTKMLKEVLRNLNMEYTDKTHEKNCYVVLKECTKLFDNILDYINKIEKAYSSIILLKFAQSIIDCTMPFYVLTNVGIFDVTLITRAAIFVSIALWIMFLQCIAATIVTDEISTLAFAMYESKWNNNISPRLRISSLMLIQRAQKGAVMKAGGLINVNMTNFVAVCRFAFSAYTLLATTIELKN